MTKSSKQQKQKQNLKQNRADDPGNPELFSPYSVVHFLSGVFMAFVMSGYASVQLVHLVIFHVCFEIFENSDLGVKFFAANNQVWSFIMPLLEKFGISWSVYTGDSAINSNVDTLCFTLGALLVQRPDLFFDKFW